MIIYYGMCTFLLAISNIEKKKFLYSFVFLVLFVVMGYRGVDVGTDVLQYEYNFSIIENVPVYLKDPLWYNLNLYIHRWGGSFRIVLITSTILFLVPFYYLFKRVSFKPFLSILFFVLFYLYINSFNAVRQSIAIAWIVLGIYFFESNRKLSYLFSFLCFFVAFGFHLSTLLVLLFIGLKVFIKKVEMETVFILAAFIMGAFFAPYIFNIVMSIVGYSNLVTLNLLGNAIVAMSTIVLFLIVKKVIIHKDCWYYYYVVYVVISMVLLRIPFGYRISMFLIFAKIIVLTNIFYKNKLVKSNQNLLKGIILIYAFIYFTVLLSSNFGDVVPYKFSLE